ncbi:MAG: ribose-phosphate diphosphokinase, partial [Phycisphaeraceae bacterium]
EHFAPFAEQGPLAVVSPDIGGVKRAEIFRQILSERSGHSIASAFMEKRRSNGVVSGEMLVGDVRDRTAVLFDDMIATGTTLVRAARACAREGAKRVFAAATHGLFVAGSPELLADPAIEQIVVSDTVPPFRIEADLAEQRIITLPASTLFAEAIRRMHQGESVTDLLPR